MNDSWVMQPFSHESVRWIVNVIIYMSASVCRSGMREGSNG